MNFLHKQHSSISLDALVLFIYFYCLNGVPSCTSQDYEAQFITLFFFFWGGGGGAIKPLTPEKCARVPVLCDLQKPRGKGVLKYKQ